MVDLKLAFRSSALFDGTIYRRNRRAYNLLVSLYICDSACSHKQSLCQCFIATVSLLIARKRRALNFYNQKRVNKLKTCLNCATKEVRETLLSFVDMFNVLYMQSAVLSPSELPRINLIILNRSSLPLFWSSG